jgi:tryptophan synthase alpha chain
LSENPIVTRWRAVKAERRAALVVYLTAGHPDQAASLAALKMVAAEGADFVEVGIPYSDPLADGPVIQKSSFEALERGASVAKTLAMIKDARLDVPVIAFSYLNPILAYGLPRFLKDAAAAGVSGLLLTDLPVGADPKIESTVASSPIALIRLVAPTTEDARLASATKDARGFLYLIARLGVTGARTTVDGTLQATVERVRKASGLPIAVGFGIASGEQVGAVAKIADGVVVGTALVERLAQGLEPARALMRELRGAVGRVSGAA